MNRLVYLAIEDEAATITLDSHHNRNALSRQLLGELSECLTTADEDTRSKAILIRSASTVFCSGMDLSEAVADTMADGPKALVALQRQLVTTAKPVVVELAGRVRAAGLGIVGAADIVIAAESVSFQLTEVRLGLAAAGISLSLLPRLTDRAASKFLLTGRSFDATEAKSAGLVTDVVPDEGLQARVTQVLEDLTKAHPQGLRASKEILNRELVARIDALGDDMATTSAELFASTAAREAMSAFLSR